MHRKQDQIRRSYTQEVHGEPPEHLLEKICHHTKIVEAIRVQWGTVQLKVLLDSHLGGSHPDATQSLSHTDGAALLEISLANIHLLESKGLDISDPLNGHYFMGFKDDRVWKF